MSNEVTIEVKADNDTKHGLDAARKDVDSFSKDAVKSALSTGAQIGGNFAKSIGSTFAQAGASLGPILGGVGAVAAPFIASALSGAIIGGVGVGGVVGGFMVASKDPRVKSAIDDVSSGFKTRMEGAAGAFVQPAIDGIGQIEKALDTIDIEAIFADSAKNVEPVFGGISRLIEGIGDGIEDLMHNAGPVVKSIGQGIGDIGEALGEGLSSIADNGESAADSLTDVFNAVELGVNSIFMVVNALTELQEINSKLGGDTGLKLLRQLMGDNKEVVGEWVDETEAATDAATSFQRALKDVHDELKKQVDPVFALIDAQSDLKDLQKELSEATKKHGEDSIEAEQATLALAKGAIELDGAMADLGGTFDGKVSPSLRNTLKAAGMTDAAIDDLQDQFETARKSGERFSKRYQASVALTGYPAVYRQLYNVNDIARDIPNAVNIALRITGASSVSEAAASIRKQYAHGGITGAANGATSGGLTWVGENGMELLDLPPGTNVRSNPDSMRQMAAQGGGGGVMVATMAPTGNAVLDELGRWVVEHLQFTTRTQYGGDVTNMLGGNN
jgi:hypothetical protein